MAAVPTALRAQEVDDADRELLLRRLRRFRLISLEGESSRRARDRKGFKLSRSIMWDEGITRGRHAITANIASSLIDRLNATLTRNRPMPQVEAIAGADDEAAALLQGGVVTNWRFSKMQEKLKQGQDQCTYTRPVGWYGFWDAEARGGLGDVDTRLVPGWRLIIDDRVLHPRDMEFCGFREDATRARLIMLFPDKADAIEDAANASLSKELPNTPGDPLRYSETSTASTLERNVVALPLPYLGKTSVKTRRENRARDPLADTVEVEYLWYKDPTPTRFERIKHNDQGQPMREFVTDEESGEIQFDVQGWEVADSPFGPIHQPNLQPRTRPVYETVVRKKYPYWRHVAWIPHDGVILWDVKWDGPVPLAIQRDGVPITGFHCSGRAQRLFDLALARNVLYTIIFERLKLSLGGTWLAGARSGLKQNKLTPEAGQVYQVTDIEQVKQFPVQPLDAAYFQLLDKIEIEMQSLLGLSAPMQGEAAGRADSPATYDKLIEAGGVSLVSEAQLIEGTISDWAEIVIWFMQHFYTHEHYVEIEDQDGQTSWRAASALALRGDFAVHVETGSMIAYSESAMFNRAKEYSALGFYALPMLGKVGHVPFWRQALRQKLSIMANPQQAQALLGAGGGTPAQASALVRTQGRRSHHAPGR